MVEIEKGESADFKVINSTKFKEVASHTAIFREEEKNESCN
jgi:hypothetical protein